MLHLQEKKKMQTRRPVNSGPIVMEGIEIPQGYGGKARQEARPTTERNK